MLPSTTLPDSAAPARPHAAHRFLSSSAIRGWTWVHKWSSLVSTAFMLLLCLTGLPLIFHHEIGHLLGTEIEPPAMAADAPRVSLDKVLKAGQERYPGKVVQFVSPDEDDDRFYYVTLGDTPTDDKRVSLAVDARTGEALPTPKFDEGFIYVMFRLHVDLFAGLPGKLFLGFMGLLLLVAIVSGVVLYAPFMRKLEFGTVRRERSRRTKWLDLHNLLGVVTLVWAFVVGATGMINTWADLVFKLWQNDQMAEMVAPYKGLPPTTARGSLQESVDASRRLLPHMDMRFVAFPGTDYSSPHHYAVFMKGNTPLTSRLLQPVLVDAETAKITDSRPLPWYGTALLVSQPLHFGDYGGTPLQILWALLDIATIIVLGSGLYLWIRKR
ncbi:PepSY-associated TM helix domain-containing protein [Xylophilus sp. ASV27]|uniref:PepSY-associated TM helix domain-containing protein n=1 Tax=Xylophilus sp. ASV27 TaxID=2795129 RepID=UPI0018EB7396|nr:PepSY domain-containing protein [Xylophilus sp. ASV27]